MAWSDKVNNLNATAARTFGDSITYEPDGLAALVDIDGIFRAHSVDVDLDTGTESLIEAPAVELPYSVLPRDPLGVDETGVRDVVVHNGTRYAVTTWELDGFGIVTLNLRLES